MFSAAIAPGKATTDQQCAFDDVNAEFYKNTDWAIDISEAAFVECEIQGVPAALIRRDPTTQVVVKRDKAAQGRWREINLSKTHWPVSLELFLKRGDAEVVLVAPRRNKNFKALLDGLRALQDEGVAEPG